MRSHTHTYPLLIITCSNAGKRERYCQTSKKEALRLSLASNQCFIKEQKEINRKDFKPQSVVLIGKKSGVKREKRLKFPYRNCLKAYNGLPLERRENKTKKTLFNIG